MYDWGVEEQLMRLRVTIQHQRQALAELEAEVEKVRRQLEPIQRRYDRIVRPIADRVLVLRDAVRDLEGFQRRQAKGSPTPLESLWKESWQWHKRPQFGDYDRSQPPGPEALIPRQRPKATEDIKKVYRKLALRYHPDLANNEEDRLHRNALMARINDAYGERDLEALLALSYRAADEPEEVGDVPLAVLKLRRMIAESAELSERIQELKVERFDLTHSVLFDLKIQEKWDKRTGRNPLEEMAAWFELEYERLNKRLNELRGKVE
jgi:hypothetical protein